MQGKSGKEQPGLGLAGEGYGLNSSDFPAAVGAGPCRRGIRHLRGASSGRVEEAGLRRRPGFGPFGGCRCRCDGLDVGEYLPDNDGVFDTGQQE